MLWPVDRRGLTLFEVMVAMAVLVVVMTMMYQAMSAGIGFSDRGRARIDELERHSAIVDLLHRQIYAAMYDADKRGTSLKVEEDQLSFVSQVPLIAAHGPVFVNYRVDSGRLYYLERRDYFNEDYWEEEPSLRDMLILMDDAGDLAFAESEDPPGGVTVSHDGESYTVYPRCMRVEEER